MISPVTGFSSGTQHRFRPWCVVFLFLCAALCPVDAVFASPPVPSPSPAATVAAPAPPAPEPASTGQAGFTLQQAVAVAEGNNPTLTVAQAQAREAYQAYLSAEHIPALTITGNILTGSNTIVTTNGQATDLNLSLQQAFGPINNQAWTAKVALRAYQAAVDTVTETRTTLDQGVKDAFYNLLASQENIVLTQQTLDLAKDIYDKSYKRFTAGAGPRMDVVSAQITLASSQQAMLTAESAVRQAQYALNLQLARPPMADLKVQGDLALPEVNNIDSTSLMRQAQNTRGLVKSAQANVQQALDQVHQTRSLANPNPTFFADYDLVNTSLYSFGLSVSYPIVDWGQQRHLVKQQEETVGEKRATLQLTVSTIDQSVAAALDTYQTARANVETFKQQVVEPSETLMTMTQIGFDKGALPYLQVLTAEQTLKGARTQYASLLMAGHQALDALEAAVGTKLEGDTR